MNFHPVLTHPLQRNILGFLNCDLGYQDQQFGGLVVLNHKLSSSLFVTYYNKEVDVLKVEIYII